MAKKNKTANKIFSSRWFAALVIMAVAGAAVWALSGYAWGGLISDDVFLVRGVKTNADISPAIRNAIVGRTVFALSTRKIYDFTRAQHPEFKNIQVIKQFPSTIIIKVVKRIPVLQLTIDGYYDIDQEGVVVSGPHKDPLPGLPVVQLSEKAAALAKGARIEDARLPVAVEFTQALRRNGYFNKLPISVINVAMPAALYFIVNDTKVIVGEGDYDRKLKVFSRILREECKDDLSGLEYIDVRYQRAYLGYRR